MLAQIQGWQRIQDDEQAPVDDAAVATQETQTPVAEEAAPAEQQVEQAVAEGQATEVAAEQQTTQEAAPAEAQAAEADAQSTAQVEVQTEQQTQADDAEIAEAEAAVRAEHQAKFLREQEAKLAADKKRGKVLVQTEASQQAAALAAAADSLLPEDKEWSKMSQAEKKLKKLKDAKAKREKAAKEARENPTVDANGEHIQTVAEAKEEARQLQEMLVAGEAAVEQKIAMEQEELAKAPAMPEPSPEDDGHEETVEEVRAKMAACQKQMDEGLAATDQRVAQMEKENGDMPNFGALADLHGSISNMGKMRKRKQLNDMAAKLGVDIVQGDEDLPAEELTNTLIERAKAAGKSDKEINAALAE